MSETVRLDLPDTTATIDPSGAVLLEAAGVLVVGDLHLGRATVLQRAGLALPGGSDDDDLDRLAAVTERTGAVRVILLGDVVHARAAAGPALSAALARLGALPVPVDALPGNHDPRLGELLHGSGVGLLPRRVRVAGAELTHHPRVRPAGAGARLRIAAHLHPVATLGRGPDAVRLPAVVVGRSDLTLPAFGSTTGGALVAPGPGRRVFAVTGASVHELPARPATG